MIFCDFVELANIVKIKLSHKFLIVQYIFHNCHCPGFSFPQEHPSNLMISFSEDFFCQFQSDQNEIVFSPDLEVINGAS